MENLSNNIASKITKELKLDNDNKEIIAYGTFALLQMALSIAMILVFGYIFHVLVEALIISFSTSALRKYSGGVHASSPNKCLIIGTTICIGQAIIISFFSKIGISVSFVLLLGSATFIWSYYCINRFAPVDSSSKPITKDEKRKKMKKMSLLILSVYLIINIVSIFVYVNLKDYTILKYSLCLYVGIVWQSFTLTNSGHLLINKIDGVLNHVL